MINKKKIAKFEYLKIKANNNSKFKSSKFIFFLFLIDKF